MPKRVSLNFGQMTYTNRRYRNRSKPRRGGGQRAAFRSAGATAGDYAYKAYKMAKFVKSIVNTEFKFSDQSQTGMNLDSAGWQWNALSLLAQGDDNYMRNGKSILPKSLGLECDITLKGALDYTTVRCVVLRYNACNGGNPVSTDVFATTSGFQAVNSFRNIQTGPTSNYTILYDQRFTLDTSYKSQIHISKYWKLYGHIKYIGTTSAVGSAGPGNLFIGFISDSPTSATDYCGVDFITRLRYIDN